jgi:2-oxoglutarate dehydrogenase E1 component
MARQDQANDRFSMTSFLHGTNAAYVEELYADWQKDPTSVGQEWRDFFAAMKDDAADVEKNARGASWKKPGWPVQGNGEWVSALDGDWAQV